MGGIGLVELVCPAPQEAQRVTADWLASLRRIADELKLVDQQLIGEVLSLADVLAGERQGQNKTQPGTGDREADAGRSATRETTADQVIRAKLRVLSLPAFEHFLANFWDRSNGQTRFLVRIREGAEAEEKQRAFEKLLAIVRTELGETSYITGLSHLMTQVTSAIITTQFQSTLLSCALIAFMLLLALRNPVLAILALLPTLLAVGLVLGAMGWLGIRIDLSTALVASVAMGLSVDDTFHCLLRWKREVIGVGVDSRRDKPGGSLDAIRRSYAGTGPGVVLSSAAVSLGFLALIFSEFVPTANFGWLVAVGTLGGSLGNLVVLPACLALLWRGTETSGGRAMGEH
jgi:hypothetical protein